MIIIFTKSGCSNPYIGLDFVVTNMSLDFRNTFGLHGEHGEHKMISLQSLVVIVTEIKQKENLYTVNSLLRAPRAQAMIHNGTLIIHIQHSKTFFW